MRHTLSHPALYGCVFNNATITSVQYVREFTKNCIETIERYIKEYDVSHKGRVVWGIAKNTDEVNKQAICENGTGLTPSDIECLTVLGKSNSGSLNFGMGGRISILGQYPFGIFYYTVVAPEVCKKLNLSESETERYIHIWLDGSKNRLYTVDELDENEANKLIDTKDLKNQIKKWHGSQWHGTCAVILGSNYNQDTTNILDDYYPGQTKISKIVSKMFIDFPRHIEFKHYYDNKSGKNGTPIASLSRLREKADHIDEQTVNCNDISYKIETIYLKPDTRKAKKAGINVKGVNENDCGNTFDIKSIIALIYAGENYYPVETPEQYKQDMKDYCGINFKVSEQIAIFITPDSEQFEPNNERSKLILKNSQKKEDALALIPMICREWNKPKRLMDMINEDRKGNAKYSKNHILNADLLNKNNEQKLSTLLNLIGMDKSLSEMSNLLQVSREALKRHTGDKIVDGRKRDYKKDNSHKNKEQQEEPIHERTDDLKPQVLPKDITTDKNNSNGNKDKRKGHGRPETEFINDGEKGYVDYDKISNKFIINMDNRYYTLIKTYMSALYKKNNREGYDDLIDYRTRAYMRRKCTNMYYSMLEGNLKVFENNEKNVIDLSHKFDNFLEDIMSMANDAKLCLTKYEEPELEAAPQ